MGTTSIKGLPNLTDTTNDVNRLDAAVGETCQVGGTVYQYVKASAAIAQYAFGMVVKFYLGFIGR